MLVDTLLTTNCFQKCLLFSSDAFSAMVRVGACALAASWAAEAISVEMPPAQPAPAAVPGRLCNAPSGPGHLVPELITPASSTSTVCETRHPSAFQDSVAKNVADHTLAVIPGLSRSGVLNWKYERASVSAPQLGQPV